MTEDRMKTIREMPRPTPLNQLLEELNSNIKAMTAALKLAEEERKELPRALGMELATRLKPADYLKGTAAAMEETERKMSKALSRAEQLQQDFIRQVEEKRREITEDVRKRDEERKSREKKTATKRFVAGFSIATSILAMLTLLGHIALG